LDHGLTPEHLVWLCNRFANRTSFFIETVELPPNFLPLTCGLHGPLVGDEPVPEGECLYETRGTRAGQSRMCRRPLRMTRTMTVVAGPSGEDSCVLYTAYGGPAAPREPFDPNLSPEEKAESEAFWRDHALSVTT
jgi:hypothetical protein